MKTKKVKDENMDLNPYEVDKLARVPSWIKILLLKYWAAAAACFLLFGASELGLNVYSDSVDGTVKLIMLLGLFFTILMNYPIRVIIRLMYNRRNNTYRYNMINMKGLKTFPLALVYNFIIAVIAFIIIVDVLSPNGLVFDPFGTTGGIGIEPFTVGFIYLFVDGIFLIIKYFSVSIYQRLKYKKQIHSKFEFSQGLGD
jgi:hypothetical protein